MKKITLTNPQDYFDWLDRYLESGGQPTHYYDYSVNSGMSKLYRAVSDFEIGPLYGSSSISIIIPSGIKLLNENSSDNVGHNNLYFWDLDKKQSRWIPVYEDYKAKSEKTQKLISDFIRKEQLQDWHWDQMVQKQSEAFDEESFKSKKLLGINEVDKDFYVAKAIKSGDESLKDQINIKLQMIFWNFVIIYFALGYLLTKN